MDEGHTPVFCDPVVDGNSAVIQLALVHSKTCRIRKLLLHIEGNCKDECDMHDDLGKCPYENKIEC